MILIKFKYVYYSSNMALDIGNFTSGYKYIPLFPEVELRGASSVDLHIRFHWHTDAIHQARVHWTVDPGCIIFLNTYILYQIQICTKSD
jgi:hypothetical protein